MNEPHISDRTRSCCGMGLGWGRLLWMLLGLLGVAALAALPSMLEAALSNSGLF